MIYRKNSLDQISVSVCSANSEVDSDGGSFLSWEKRRAKLVRWRKERGHRNVPKAEGNLVRQRELHKNEKLKRREKSF